MQTRLWLFSAATLPALASTTSAGDQRPPRDVAFVEQNRAVELCRTTNDGFRLPACWIRDHTIGAPCPRAVLTATAGFGHSRNDYSGQLVQHQPIAGG